MSTVAELLSLFATFFLAGWFAGWIVVPTRLGSWDRLFLSLALSVPTTLLAAAPALATHSLAAWNVLLGIAVLGALAAWRGKQAFRRLPTRLRAMAARPKRPPLTQTALIICALVATWFTVLVPEGVRDTGRGHPNGTIVYYHWGIVSKVVDAGGLPATLPEWGKPREFPYEYAFSVMHAAATASLAGTTNFVLEERYRIAMVVVALFSLFALWRCWLPSWWSWLAALLTMNVSRIETRLLVYKPEAFAFFLVVWSAWLLDRALERRSPRWGALAGLVLATSFLAHPVGSLLVAPLWGGIAIGRAAPVLWRRWRQRSAPVKEDRPSDDGTRKRWPALRAALPWPAVAAALVVFAVLFLSFRTIIGTTGQDLSQSPVDHVDETRVVYNLAYVSANPFATPHVPECSHPFAVYSTIRPFFSANAAWFFFDVHARSSVFLMIGALVLLGGVFLWQRPPRLARWPDSAKRAVITWCCYGIGVYLLAVLICVYYSTWVPQRVGPMRLMPYWALVFPIAIAGVCWAGSAIISRHLPSGLRLPRFAGQASWFGAGVAVLPALAFSVASVWTFTTIVASQDRGVPAFEIAEPRAGGLSQDAIDSYSWISKHLPSEALILANGYTEGALGMLSHRTGLLDGRTPFAQPDPWRREAIEWLEQSRRYFKHPRATKVPGKATYVLVASRDANLGGSYFPTDFQAVREDPALRLLHRFGEVTLYEVRSPKVESDGQVSLGGGINRRVHSANLEEELGKWDPIQGRAASFGRTEASPSC